MGKIDFSKPLLFLAPLAGYTDLPFRKVVKKFGADVTVSEMISANALIRNSKKSFKMLQKNENETPYIVQIAGSDPEVIKEAVLILHIHLLMSFLKSPLLYQSFEVQRV